ncbi:MAG TPA: flagellar basal body P-ring formation chaperone FlgA [Balneolaceae bacterium]|nr:flagellar basal body P-ring formation chaperone FlgA [Balneolaceae bacterium]
MRVKVLLCFIVAFVAQLQPVRAEAASGIRQKIKTLAAKKVKSECPSCKVTVECKWISPTIAKKSPAAVKKIAFSKPGLPAGYVATKIVFKSGKNPPDSQAQLHISVRRKLPVAQKMLKKGSSISVQDIAWQWKDISRLTRTPVSNRKYFKEKTTTRLIQKGQLFFPSDLAGSGEIKAGDHVTMRYSKGGVRINIDCTARETKKAGQKIRLYSKETSRLYIAKIISKNKIIWVKTL